MKLHEAMAMLAVPPAGEYVRLVADADNCARVV
jgi:hypothetical protein